MDKPNPSAPDGTHPRRFNKKQRSTLFLRADGYCERCGAELPRSWHADHAIPWSAGGPTAISNGQALCPTCNLSKGATMPVQPRPWQQRFLAKYHANTSPDFLCVACPGAGKSLAAALAAADLLRQGTVERILVVVPSHPLRKQWYKTFASLGIYLDYGTMNNTHGEMATVGGNRCQGWIVTYHSLNEDAAQHERHATRKRTVAILDEVHHLSDASNWGGSAVRALGPCVRRLSLSGTPFRTDGADIPFTESRNGWARYQDDPDGTPYPRGFDYSYGKALAEKPSPVRPAVFETYDSDVEWFDGDLMEERKVKVSDALVKKVRSKANRMVLEPSGQWLQDTFRAADLRLSMVRQEGDSDAKGLVICADTAHATAVAKVMKRVAGNDQVMTATSRDEDGEESSAEARRIIEAFGEGGARWLVAVAMVSEGVDIPQLRVGVYATTYRSELFFLQVLGRLVRMRKLAEDIDQTAYMFVPKDPALIAIADKTSTEVQEAVMQALVEDLDEDEKGGGGGGSWQPSLNFDAFVNATSEAAGILVPGQGTFDHRMVDEVVKLTGKNAAVVLDVLRAAQLCGASIGADAPAATALLDAPAPMFLDQVKARKNGLEKALRQMASMQQRKTGGDFKAIISRLKSHVYREAGISDYMRADLPEIDRAMGVVRKLWLNQ